MEGGVTNVYLQETVLRILHRRKHAFLGVYSCNELLTPDFISKVKRRLKKRLCSVVITNLAPANTEGTHFVCVCIHSKFIGYFDSLGLGSTADTNVYKFMQTFERKKGVRRRKIVNVVKHAIQHASSSFCGLYCLAYVLMCHQAQESGEHSRFVQRNFVKGKDVGDEALLKNDNKVVHYIKRAITDIRCA